MGAIRIGWRRRAVAGMAVALGSSVLATTGVASAILPPEPSVDIDQTAMLVDGPHRHVPISITGFEGVEELSVVLALPADAGSLSVEGHPDLELSYGYMGYVDEARIGFTGPVAAVTQTLADGIWWNVPSDADRPVVELAVSVVQHAPGTFFNPDNGHYYEQGVVRPVSDSMPWLGPHNIVFADAVTAASQRALHGMTGYLATITSASENEFVGRYVDATNVWIGATDEEGPRGFATDWHEGQWRWVSGPEAGQQFWDQYASDEAPVDDFEEYWNRPNGMPIDGRYAAWAADEPNDWDGGEDYAVTNWLGRPGLWNDLPNVDPQQPVSHYLIEYGGFSEEVSTALHASTTERIAWYVPTAPLDVAATAGSWSAAVSWSAPADDGGSPVTGYIVTSEPGGRTCAAVGTGCTVTGLAAGTAHTFTVVAHNAFGTGAASDASAPVTPTAPPAAVPEPYLSVVPGPGPDATLDGGRISFEFTNPRGTRPSLEVVVAGAASGDARGITAASERFDVTPHDLAFDSVEVCIAVPRANDALDGRPVHRLRLVHTTGADAEEDITTRVDLGTTPPIVCGVADSFSSFQAVVYAGDRVAGTDRYATAAAVANDLHPDGAEVVYIATGEDHPDALVAGAAAAAADAPLLLAGRASLPEATTAALRELGPSEVVVVGGSSAVGDEVVARIRSATGTTVRRLAGADRYATSAVVALEVGADGVDVVHLATGASFPDALAAGAAAQPHGGVVLLVSPAGVPPAAASALRALAPARAVVVGGTSAVPVHVADAVDRIVGDVARVGGTDRYATAAALAAPREPGGTVVAATGAAFADALVATTLAARHGAPVLLVAPDRVPRITGAVLGDLDPAYVVVVGGTAAVGRHVELALIRMLPDLLVDRL